MGMGYGMGNTRSQVERRNERMKERYGRNAEETAEAPKFPDPPRKRGRPKGSKKKIG